MGLGLAAVAIFFAFIVYLEWDGGKVGALGLYGSRWLLGALYIVLPAALLVGALALIAPLLRQFIVRVLPSAICCWFGVALAFAAGTFHLGPGGPHSVSFAPGWISAGGGAVGESLYWACTSIAGRLGAHLVAVSLVFASFLLLPGVSLARIIEEGFAEIEAALRGMRAARVRAGEMSDRFKQWRKARSVADPAAPVGDLSAELAGHESVDEDPTVRVNPDVFADDFETEPEPKLAEDSDEEAPGVMRTRGSTVTAADLTPQGNLRSVVTDSPDFNWRLPSASALKRSSGESNRPDQAAQAKVASALTEALGHFGVESKIIGMVAGPHITRYELRLAPGIKVGKVAALKDDLAYALAASDIRILAPIPGKQAVGVEVPNAHRRIVHLGDVLQTPPPDWSPLTVWLGKDVAGRAIAADLAKMPHLLVAGTTGAGKSGCINAMLASILLRATPHDVRMVLVDPKQVELNHYESIPHLLTPVITSPRQAATALANLVREMESRYSYMSVARTRSLPELNRVRESRQEPPLPYVLCVIDELADLMMVAPADVEDSIIRLAQKARAVGIHLVLATQSPRVDVITGMIKANVPSRIAFAVSSQTDSRVILDQNGAETLLGQGDMLFSPVGSSRLQRIQGAFVTELEIEAVTDDWRDQGKPEFREELLEEVESKDDSSNDANALCADEDPLLADAVRLVAEMQTASTSMLQRRLRLGYTRAGRLIDMLERRGVISGYEGSKPRQVLISEADLPRVLQNLAERGDQTLPVEQLAAEGSVASSAR